MWTSWAKLHVSTPCNYHTAINSHENKQGAKHRIGLGQITVVATRAPITLLLPTLNPLPLPSLFIFPPTPSVGPIQHYLLFSSILHPFPSDCRISSLLFSTDPLPVSATVSTPSFLDLTYLPNNSSSAVPKYIAWSFLSPRPHLSILAASLFQSQ